MRYTFISLSTYMITMIVYFYKPSVTLLCSWEEENFLANSFKIHYITLANTGMHPKTINWLIYILN